MVDEVEGMICAGGLYHFSLDDSTDEMVFENIELGTGKKSKKNQEKHPFSPKFDL